MLTPTARRLIPIAGLMIAIFVAAFAVSPTTMWGYDPNISRQVAHSMVTEGSFRVHYDPLGINIPYASYGIGMSLMMAVAEILAPIADRPAPQLDTLINPVLLALIGLVIWLTLRRIGASNRQASLVALIVTLASPLLPYAASTFSEVGTALGVAGGIWGILVGKDRAYLGGVVAGAAVGFAGLTRPDSFVLIAPVVALGAVIASRDRRLNMAGLATGVLPAVAVTLAYNAVRFGSPLTMQYQGLALSESFPSPFWTGLYGLLASPGRGIVFYAPVVILVGVGLRWSWQRSRLLTTVCLVLLVDRLLFYASWWAWHGGTGWGPRFLVPALPALAPFVFEVVRRLASRTVVGGITVSSRQLAATVAFTCLIAMSLSVQVVGSITDPNRDALMTQVNRNIAQAPRGTQGFMQFATTPPMLAAWSDPMMDWSLFPIRDHARQVIARRNLIGRYLSPRLAFAPLAGLGLLFSLAVVGTFVREDENPETGNPEIDKAKA